MGSTDKADDGAGGERSRITRLVAAGTTLQAIGQRVLDGLLPPRCAACGQEIESGQGLCAGCWGRLTFIDAPHCACCGLPFDFEISGTTLCGACLADPPPFDRARAALVYDDHSRSLILGFKHGDRTDRAGVLGRLMARLLAGLDAPVDVVVPVPLHRWRLWRRRYNQSALLAQAIADAAEGVYRHDALVRTRATPSQARRNARERRQNVRGAFKVEPRAVPALAGRHVLLVDDVMTTGATVRECARVLKQSGAAEVSVLVIARAVLPVRVG